MSMESGESRYEAQRKRAERILLTVEERLFVFPQMRDRLFAAHQEEPQSGTFKTISDEIHLFLSEIERVQKILVEAQEGAKDAKDKPELKRCTALFARSNKALRTVMRVWDDTFRKAAEGGALLPEEELRVVEQTVGSLVPSTQILLRYIRVLMDTKADKETGEVSEEEESRLTEFFDKLVAMAEGAMDRADVARRGAPDNERIIEESTRVIQDLHEIIEKIEGVRESAIEAGLLSDPDYFDDDR